MNWFMEVKSHMNVIFVNSALFKEVTYLSTREFIQVKSHIHYTCEICEKTFKTSSNLINHKKVQIVEKPNYECVIC